MNFIPQFKKIDTPEERQAVVDAAVANNDNMVFPSHVAYKNGEIIGGYSLNVVPAVMCWTHSEKATARDSLQIKRCIDSVMSDRGNKIYMTACNSDSPYYQHMEKFGYHPIWPTNIFWTQS